MARFLAEADRMLGSVGLKKRTFFIDCTEPKGYTPCYVNMEALLRGIKSKKCFFKWQAALTALHGRYEALCRADKKTDSEERIK